jgi:hypothetical protein
MMSFDVFGAFRSWVTSQELVAAAGLQLVLLGLLGVAVWAAFTLVGWYRAACRRRNEAKALERLADKALQPKKGW